MKCDHIIGWLPDCEGTVLVSVKQWRNYIGYCSDSIERWPFCPLCGENIESLKEPRQRKIKPSDLSPLMEKESKRFSKMIFKALVKTYDEGRTDRTGE